MAIGEHQPLENCIRITPLINEKGEDVREPVSRLIQRAVDGVQAGGEFSIFHQIAEKQGHKREPRQAHPALIALIGPDILSNTEKIRQILLELGATAIAVKTKPVIFDEVKIDLSYVSATGAEAAEESDNMTRRIWVRDQAFVAEALLSGESEQDHTQGKQLLSSLLHCMGTPSQLARFDRAIEAQGQVHSSQHPSIMYEWKGSNQGVVPILNLETNDWRHNQDAWQILASVALKGYEQGQVEKELLTQNMDFFKRIPAYMEATKYLERESAGSWEEITAKGRLSTIAWDWSILTQLYKHADIFNFDPAQREKMRKMIGNGAQAIVERFPAEATAYHKPADPEYRKEDAALLYIGLAEVPEKLAQLEDYGCQRVDFTSNPAVAQEIAHGLRPVDAMYKVMFETVDKLKDPLTGGYGRYYGDSYESSGFWTPSVWNALEGRDETGNGNLWTNEQYRDSQGRIHYIARNELIDTVNGFRNESERNQYSARWMHPNAQAATVAFRCSEQTEDYRMKEWYVERGKRDMRDALRMITGRNELTIQPSSYTGMEIRQMPEGVAPECYVTNKLPDGGEVTHVGPWGPLFWSAAGLRGMILQAGKRKELQVQSRA